LFEQCWGFEPNVIVRNAAFLQTSHGNLQLLSSGGKVVKVNHPLAICQVVALQLERSDLLIT